MKRIISIVLPLGNLTAFAQTQIAAKDRMVTVISLDGFLGSTQEDPKQPVPTRRRKSNQNQLVSQLFTLEGKYFLKTLKRNFAVLFVTEIYLQTTMIAGSSAGTFDYGDYGQSLQSRST